MRKQLLHTFLLALVSAGTTYAQTIETPANTALSVTSDLTLPNGKAFQIDNAPFIRLFNPATGNVAVGVGSFSSTAGAATNNTALGYQAGATSTGNNNVFLGYLSGRNNQSGSFNLFMGPEAGRNNQTGGFNVFIGSQSGFNNQAGAGNFFMGQQAGFNNTTGNYNLFIGNSSGTNNVSGEGNVALGDGAGVNSKGSNNTFVGRYAGFGASATNGGENAFIGYAAGYNITTGIGNVGIGRGAGVATTTGNYNTFIGYLADATSANLTNAVAIGANARVGISNAIALGGTGASAVNVGIGTSSPTARVHISSGVANSSGLRLENLTSGSAASVSASKFLTVDASGNVVLASYSAGAREGIVSADALWEKRGNLLQSVSGTGVVVGTGVTKLPVGYSLYVGQGLLAERIKVAVKNSSEWSDYVFAPGYRLRELSEVEAYVKANKHLPGVPSAEQVVEEGVDVVKMNAKLLEKIEELTLYMIDLKKENQQIKAENKEIKQMLKKQATKK